MPVTEQALTATFEKRVVKMTTNDKPEEFFLTRAPDKATALVATEREELETAWSPGKLKKLLGNANDLLFLARNGVADFPKLRNSVYNIFDDFHVALKDCGVAFYSLSSFARSIVSEMPSVARLLDEKEVERAITRLKTFSKASGRIAAEATKLAETFTKLHDRTKGVAMEASNEQQIGEEKKKQLEERLKTIEAENADIKELLTSIAGQKQLLEEKYEDIKSSLRRMEDTVMAKAILDAVIGPLANAVTTASVAYAGGPGTGALPKLPSNGVPAPAGPNGAVAKPNPKPDATIIGGDSKPKPVSGDATPKPAPTPDASPEPPVLTDTPNPKPVRNETGDVASANGKTIEDMVAEYNTTRSQVITLQMEVMSKQGELLGKQASNLLILTQTKDEKKIAETTLAALELASAALESIGTCFTEIAGMWEKLSKKLSESESKGEDMSNDLETIKKPFFDDKTFAGEFMHYWARWVAVLEVVTDIKTHAEDAFDKATGYLTYHPTREEARKIAKELGTKLITAAESDKTATERQQRELAAAK